MNEPETPARTVADLLPGIGAELVSGDPATPVRGLAGDSREVHPGWLFAAIPGGSADGHRYLGQAVAAGATALLVSDPSAAARWPGLALLVAADPRRALGRAASRFHGSPSRALTVVAITGTNGKTTSTFLMRAVLDAAGLPAAALGTTGLHFGGRQRSLSHTTPEGPALQGMLEDLRAQGARAVALEASSHALDQGRLAGTDVDVGVYTHLTRDHLDYHGTMEEYAQAKERLVTELLATSSKAGAGLAANRDDPYARRAAGLASRSLQFSAAGDAAADVVASHVRSGLDGVGARVRLPSRTVDLWLPHPGLHNLENALGVLTAAELLGIDAALASDALSRAPGAPGRLQQVAPQSHGPRVFVDYAHTDDALRRVLAALRPLTAGRLWCVFGCGGERDRGKRPLMGAAAAAGADRVVLTSDNPRHEDPATILADAAAGIPAGTDLLVEVDRQAAIRRAVGGAGPGDVVLIAGKGHERTQQVGDRLYPFDDLEVARRALAETSSGTA